LLLGHGFELEHEESILRRATLVNLPAVSITYPAEIITLPRRTAIKKFCVLYEQVFARLPWYQPYTRTEVASLLQTADDLLFLHLDKKLYGFVWHQLKGRMGVVEPMGVVDSLRRRGYGRCLLLAALHRLHDRGAQQAQIGTWATNQAALQLYESLGFQHEHSLYYLALNL
jgi:ribosomal protein S18 acetylase RimI-like enzyme